MPYIRLYSPDVPLEQKREIARKLIDITLHSFRLPLDERDRITIQFLPQRPLGPHLPGSRRCELRNDLTLEISDHDLTEEKRKRFVEAAAPMLTNSLPRQPQGRIARLLGREPDPVFQVAFQFRDVNSQGEGRRREEPVTATDRRAA